jgi:hypothetical protein
VPILIPVAVPHLGRLDRLAVLGPAVVLGQAGHVPHLDRLIGQAGLLQVLSPRVLQAAQGLVDVGACLGVPSWARPAGRYRSSWAAGRPGTTRS